VVALAGAERLDDGVRFLYHAGGVRRARATCAGEARSRRAARGDRGPLSSHAGRALPQSRAFVVQFHADADLARGRVSGRVEHVASAETAHFQSWHELLAFMARLVPEPPSGTSR
jgi:hypothetical protein